MKSKKFKVGMRVKVKNPIIENKLINHIGIVTCNRCKNFVGVSFNGYRGGHDNCGTCKECNGFCSHINDLEPSNLPTTEVKYPKKPKIPPYEYNSNGKCIIYAHDSGGFINPPRIERGRYRPIFDVEGFFNEQEDIPVE